jgi:putative spermidine/putrescine transport system substrate-binding protein
LTVLAAEEKVLVVQTWGGAIKDAMREAWFEPFSRQTGVKIITADATGSIIAQIKAQVMSNNVEWDIACGIAYSSVMTLLKDNLLEALDYSVIDTKEIFEDAIEKFALGQHVITDGLVYNTKKFPGENYPRNWADFWNVKKFPGPRTLIGVPYTAPKDNLSFALLADGVPKDKLYPYDLNRAFKKMDEVKPHIRAWWSSGAHSQQLFTDEEVWLGGMWNGRAVQLIRKGVPIRIVWEQGTCSYDYWAVLKNARNKKIAMEFLNFASQAKPQAEYAKRMFYGPVNKRTFENLPADIAKDFPTYPPNKEKLFIQDHKWLGDNQEMLTEKWQAWVVK